MHEATTKLFEYFLKSRQNPKNVKISPSKTSRTVITKLSEVRTTVDSKDQT